jgi:hypothetical protein
VKAANILLGREEFSTSKFWKSIPRHVWAQCPESEELSWLLGHCEALVGKENICLLTATTLDPECPAGKLEWIHKFMPKWMHRQYLLGPFKTFTASSDTLLIDDADKNIDAFRKAGGRTLIVPRPWNSFHATPTLPYLTERFRCVVQREPSRARTGAGLVCLILISPLSHGHGRCRLPADLATGRVFLSRYPNG